MWSPLAVGALALVAGLSSSFLSGGIPTLLVRLGIKSLAACVPYGAYLLILHLVSPPETESDYRRAVYMAPIGSGAIFAAIIMVVIYGPAPPLKDYVMTFSWLTYAALGFGAAYVACIEAGAWLWKRKHRATIEATMG